jgi:hypothetical protein
MVMWSDAPVLVELYRRLGADPVGAEILTTEQLAAINADLGSLLDGRHIATLNKFGNLLLIQFSGTYHGKLMVSKTLPYLSRADGDDYFLCAESRWQKVKQLAGPQKEIKVVP